MSEKTGVDLMADVFPNAPRTSAQEDGNRFDRARMGYFANRTLVEDILSDTPDEVYLTVTDNRVIIMRSMQVHNAGGAAVTLFVKLVPAGVTAASWLCMWEVSVDPLETLVWSDLDMVLEPGTQICCWGDVADDLLLKINGLYVEGQ